MFCGPVTLDSPRLRGPPFQSQIARFGGPFFSISPTAHIDDKNSCAYSARLPSLSSDEVALGRPVSTRDRASADFFDLMTKTPEPLICAEVF